MKKHFWYDRDIFTEWLRKPRRSAGMSECRFGLYEYCELDTYLRARFWWYCRNNVAGSDIENNEDYIDKLCFVWIVKLDHICKTLVINCYDRSVPTMKDKVVPMVKISNELIIITFQSLTNIQHWHTNCWTIFRQSIVHSPWPPLKHG